MSEVYNPTVCIDFDGVIHAYDSGFLGHDVVLDPPVPGAMEFIANLFRHGFRVAISSSRSGHYGGKAAMKSYMEEHMQAYARSVSMQLTFVRGIIDAIEYPSEKPPAVLYIDDRGFHFKGEFPSMEFITSFKPWNKK